ncbi:hypothetical protein L0Z65_02480 [Phaeobacter sp. BS52]|uniref:hypothetical protein n=1 Tax=Phaeobacter sp. BS52 TaxID=2907241 RepID=UPI003868AB0C
MKSIELIITYILTSIFYANGVCAETSNDISISISGETIRIPLTENLYKKDTYQALKQECGGKPIAFSEVIILNSVPGTSPILETLLDQNSNFRISQIGFGFIAEEELVEWPNKHPRFEVSRRGNKIFLVNTPGLFGNEVKVTCRANLPIYSDDDNSYACLGIGVRPSGMIIDFSFFTGEDLKGHWPKPPDMEMEFDDFSWSEPLSVIEKSIENRVYSLEEEVLCN